MSSHVIRTASIVREPTLPEAVEVFALIPFGESLKIVSRACSDRNAHTDLILQLVSSADTTAETAINWHSASNSGSHSFARRFSIASACDFRSVRFQ